MSFQSRPAPSIRVSKDCLVPSLWTTSSKNSENIVVEGGMPCFFTLNGVGMNGGGAPRKSSRAKLSTGGSFKQRPHSAVVMRRTYSTGR